jgi:hypothetical protein
MGRPIQEVKVYGVQDRRTTARATLPWIVRWSIDGRQRTKAFRTRSEAERYRSLLLAAVYDGNRFDATTAEPATWQPALPDTNVVTWVRRWLREQWTEWQPRTRTTAVESLTKFVMLATDAAPGRHEADLRRYLKSALRPDSDARDERWEKWLQDHSVLLRSRPVGRLGSRRRAVEPKS